MTILTGVLDWQNNYGGEWLPAIKIKIMMATMLTILLVTAIALGKNAEKAPIRLLVVYSLIMVSTTTLGYWGGDLIFG